MTPDQITLFGLLFFVFVFLIWGRWRYDLVAFVALMVALLTGIVPKEDAFSGFGHPATVIIALVLVVSRGLSNSGAIELVARYLIDASRKLATHIAIMSGLAASLSALMNNVAALALLMPVDLEAAKKAAREVQEAQENLMVDATRSQIRLFQGPLEMYQMHMDALPSTQQGLAALRTKPAANNTRWNGPYLQRALPQDPWGNDYRYQLVNAYQYRIWSLGQDGIDGTEDDIVGGPD